MRKIRNALDLETLQTTSQSRHAPGTTSNHWNLIDPGCTLDLVDQWVRHLPGEYDYAIKPG
jgi:hypothetical protein